MRITLLLLFAFLHDYGIAQKAETVYLSPNDSTRNMYIAVTPDDGLVNSYMFLLDGFGNSPQDVLIQTDIPEQAARQGILTIIPILETGKSYFGSDAASQSSLKKMIEVIVDKYQLAGKDLFLGGFSIGGTCAMRYAELSVQNGFLIQPKAVFAIASPLDWERYYNAAKRVIRLANGEIVNQEVSYMIERIEFEMGGNPSSAIANFYNLSPYSFSDESQQAIKNLIHTPVMLISEPDIQWWLNERGYDFYYNNSLDHSAMINELRRLGNDKARLVVTTDQGYRMPGHIKHPHSWSIAKSEDVIQWLSNCKKD